MPSVVRGLDDERVDAEAVDERPIESDHRDAISPTRSGRASSHAVSPAAVRALRSIGGISISRRTL